MRWFDGYFTRLEVTYYNYTRGLKKKVLKTLFYYKRLAILKNGKAQIKLRQTLYCKVWLALLEKVNETKDMRSYQDKLRKKPQLHSVSIEPILDKILPGEYTSKNYIFADHNESVARAT